MTNLVPVQVEERMDLRERQRTVTSQQLLGDGTEVDAGEGPWIDGHRRHPAGARLGRTPPADPGPWLVQLVVQRQGDVEQGTTPKQPRVRFGV
jgi:hypothetical protein